MSKAKCPLCEKEGSFEPHPTQKERVVLNCSCHPAGPVLETDAPLFVRTERDSPAKKEK